MVDQSPVRPGRHAAHRHRPRRTYGAVVHLPLPPAPVGARLPGVFGPLLAPGERGVAWAPADTEGFHVALFGAIVLWFVLDAHYAVAVTDARRILFVHTSPSLTVGSRVRAAYAYPLADVSLVACRNRLLGGVVLRFRLPPGAPFDSCLPGRRPRRLGFGRAWRREACAVAAMMRGSPVEPHGFAL